MEMKQKKHIDIVPNRILIVRVIIASLLLLLFFFYQRFNEYFNFIMYFKWLSIYSTLCFVHLIFFMSGYYLSMDLS